MTQDTVRQIEADILQAKQTLEFAKAYERLVENRDFRLVIRDGYLKNEAVRLVHLKADPSMQTPERQASINRDITSIGSLLQYFRTVEQSASIAAKAIELAEVERDELLAGDAA